MVQVKLRHGESSEQLLKRFSKMVSKSRILSDVRKKRWHMGKSEVRRIQRRKAIRRIRRKEARNKDKGY